MRCKNFTSSWGGTRYLPYAFTEQGIYMLMTVLRGKLATKQSLALVRLFKGMKDYISSNALISSDDFLRLSIQTNENTSSIARIEKDMLKKSDLPMIFKASSKDAGRKITTITESKDTKMYKSLIDSILNNNPLILH